MKIILPSLVRPKGGSNRPAVVLMGASDGGLTSKSVNCGNQGRMASRMAWKHKEYYHYNVDSEQTLYQVHLHSHT